MTSETFNLRSFVETQVERLASPKNLLFDTFRQTMDMMKSPFQSLDHSDEEISSSSDDLSFEFIPSETVSRSSTMNPQPDTSMESCSMSTSPISNLSMLNINLARRQSTLRRNVSESNKTDDKFLYHTNPSIDVHRLLTVDQTNFNRFRSLFRQSTDTTCTFPIRRPVRRLESIEIPGLNGAKSIRYIDDDLGRLEPELYLRQIFYQDAILNAGQVTFTVFYNQSLSSLIVTILSIDHLPARDPDGKILPNPFIKLNLLPDRRKKFQTKVYKHSLSIRCDETFQFLISYDQLMKRTLLFSVYDFCRSLKRNVIGTVKVEDFSTITDLTSSEITWTKLIKPSSEIDSDLGELTVSLCYLPNAKRVTVTIVRANALKPMDITGKSDPYVKVLLFLHGKKVRKRKTSVIFNTLNPIYNESIEFDLTQEDLEDADLIFKVIDYDRVGSNELIGCLPIGSHFDGTYRNHWYQMIENPRVPIAETYPLCESIPVIPCINLSSTK